MDWGGAFGFTLADVVVVIVFEGEAHPYKENLMKVDGRLRISQPDVSTEKLKAMSI